MSYLKETTSTATSMNTNAEEHQSMINIDTSLFHQLMSTLVGAHLNALDSGSKDEHDSIKSMMIDFFEENDDRQIRDAVTPYLIQILANELTRRERQVPVAPLRRLDEEYETFPEIEKSTKPRRPTTKRQLVRKQIGRQRKERFRKRSLSKRAKCINKILTETIVPDVYESDHILRFGIRG